MIGTKMSTGKQYSSIGDIEQYDDMVPECGESCTYDTDQPQG